MIVFKDHTPHSSSHACARNTEFGQGSQIYLLIDFVSKVGQHRGKWNFGQVGLLAYDRNRSLQRVVRRNDLAKLNVNHLQKKFVQSSSRSRI